MFNPVITSNGHTYEKSSIEKWLMEKNSDPKTRDVIVKQLIPNIALRQCIERCKPHPSMKKVVPNLDLIVTSVADRLLVFDGRIRKSIPNASKGNPREHSALPNTHQ